ADYASLKNKILTAALNGSGVLYITIDLEKADGSLCPVEISSAMIPWGGARAALVNFRDITARMRAEEQITKQAALLDSTSDAVFVLDLDGKVVFWNKRAESVYGWSREEILGENLVARVISQSGEKENIHKILMERGEWRGELSQVGRDGKEIIVESRMTLVRGRDGNPESILVINTDVTESKRLHEQFLRAQRLESIGTLAGGIAHDLNNVLQPIMLSLDLLRRRIHDEKGLRLVETLSDSAKRAASLVNQVLLFSRGQKLERKDLRLGDLIGEIRDFLSETLPKSIEIRTNLSDDLFIVSGDPTQLHQVIMNLCVNARDAMPEGGLLEISARNAFVDEYYASLLGNATAGNYVVLSVSDTGCGMSKEVMDRIFEPFFTTKAPGTGLGLPTSLRIVKDHGGFIHVYSEEGKGSQFKVYLPAAVGKEGGHLEGYEEGGELSGDGETILVVDDEENIRDLTREILEAHGYRVLLAKDGVEGVGTYTEHGDEISVVIVDMVMPVLGGSSAIKAISSVNPEVKIIATSGMQHSMEIVDESGPVVKAFLFKPFTAPTLLKTLRSVLKENS
ncbi:MAG: PAS domain S-box protein, partial [Candidatus Methanosuratincola sp.]